MKHGIPDTHAFIVTILQPAATTDILSSFTLLWIHQSHVEFHNW
jgi:hypothetical protein